MTKPYRPRIKHDPEDVVEVPAEYDMEDETFIKHMELRHSQDTGVETHSRHAMEAWVGNYRTFHQRLHKLQTPGQYDHEHEE